MFKDSITSSAVDSIRDSQELINDYAKTLLKTTLENKESPGQLGILLKSFFEHEKVLKPTRNLLYWTLKQNYIVNPTISLAQSQITYFCTEDGKMFTHTLN